MKKILFLNYEFPPLGGGASPISYEIAKGYVKLGHDVDVITMHYQNLPYFEKKDGINIYRVKCLRTKKEICNPYEQLTYIISAKNFLTKHMKNHSYDINHTHFIIPTGLIALWLKKKYNLPYIITSHGSDVLKYNPRFKLLYPLIVKKWKEILREAKVITVPSKYLQSKIEEKTKERKFTVIPNGIEKSKFKPLKKEKKILIVARLFKNKGIQDILDALTDNELKSRLAKDGWKIDIVGDGPYSDFLKNKAKKNRLQNLILFHGWVDNKSRKMKELYGHASVFISASYFESFGLTVLEALQARCYPLISDIDGHLHFNLKKENYFEVKNFNNLGDKLKKTLDKNNLNFSYSIGKNYWENIIKKFSTVLR